MTRPTDPLGAKGPRKENPDLYKNSLSSLKQMLCWWNISNILATEIPIYKIK